MNRKSVMGLGLALLLALGVARAGGENKANQVQAQQLVQAMRLGQLLGMGLLQAIFPKPSDQTLPEYKGLAQCLLALSLSEIMENYANAMLEKLTDEEILAGLGFYVSPVGQRFDEHIWYKGLQALGLSNALVPDMSVSDKALVEQFAKSKAGAALWVGRTYDTPALFNKNYKILLTISRPCMEPLRKRRHRGEASSGETGSPEKQHGK